MAEIDIQRQNYIAAIRDSISDADIELRNKEEDLKQIDALIDYCKQNKLRKFKRVVMMERRIFKRRMKFLTIHREDLVKLLGKAERYAPGKGWRK